MISENQGARPRLTQFEIMRGVAALQVLAVHYEHYFIIRKQYFPDLLLFGPNYPGAVGMVLFFVLSGFIICYSYFDKIRLGGHKDLIEYMVKRYARLWPLHVVTLVAVIVFAIPRVPANTTSLIANSTLLQAVFPPSGPMFAFNRPAWSIGVEIVCYLAFVVIVVGSRWLTRPGLVFLGALSCYLGYRLFGPWSASLATCSSSVGCGFQVAKYGGAFIFGFGLYLLMRELDRLLALDSRYRRIFAWLSLVCMLVFVFYGVLKRLLLGTGAVPLGDTEWLWITVAWLACAYVARQQQALPGILMPVYLIGVASYSVYLWHAIVLFIVDRNLHSGIAYPGAFAATLFLAYFSYRFVETPPRRWVALRMRRWANGSRGRMR